MTMHAGQNTENENMMGNVMSTQAKQIEELKLELREQLLKFMTWHSGNERNELPEGMEEIIDIYLKK